MRDGWEERAAVVGALWTFGAVLPVVVVDAVAVPGRAFGGMGILCGGVLDMCVCEHREETMVPGRTGRRCRGSRSSLRSFFFLSFG